MARIGDNKLGHTDAPGKVNALGERPGDHDRPMRIVHGMNIQQEIDFVDHRSHRAGASELDRLPRTIECGGRPDAIEIFIDKAARVRQGGIEAMKRIHIGERQRQLSTCGLQVHLEQSIERNRAAEFVAVRDHVHHRMRPRLAGIERRDVIDAAIAAAVGGNIGWR